MSKLIPEADRESMKAMTTAITNGDSKAFAEAVKKAGGDPAKLKALVGEVDKMLEEKGSSTRLDVTADGKVLVSDSGSGTALAFDPKTGNVEAKAVEQNMDGSVLVKPGELLHVDTDKAFKDMGDHAVNAVNGKMDFGVSKHEPFDPIGGPLLPHKPWIGEDPLPEHPWFPHIDPKWLMEKSGGNEHVILDKAQKLSD
jgi:FlaG/FlaF family flagellin (archaellin)